MRFSRVFSLCILLFLALVFALEYRMPKKFNWEPSYHHASRQPFGCYVLDSVLRASLPQGYTVTGKTLYQLKDEPQPMGLLVIADNLRLTETDADVLLQLAERGNRIILAAESVAGGALRDTLRFCMDYRYVAQTLLTHARIGLPRDTLIWQEDSIYSRAEFQFYPQVIHYGIEISNDSVPRRVLSRVGESIMAVEYPFGRGRIILVPTPLVFTNYTMLDGGNHAYIFRLLSRLGHLPVVRTEAYLPQQDAAQQSPLRYLLSQPPLRWAVYLTALALLLFMVFSARRRQRPIPEAAEPANKTVEFAKLIGTLYYRQRHKSKDILKNQS